MKDEMFVVPHDLDARTVAEHRRELLIWIDACEETVALDIAPGRPTQDSLQLLFAALIEARNRGLALTLGDTAAALTARVRAWGDGAGSGKGAAKGQKVKRQDQQVEVAG